jgi:signal transduction histidine kinase
VLRAAIWLARTTGVVVVGLLTFLGLPSSRGAGPTQAVAFALVCAGIAVWGLADWDRLPASLPGFVLPATFGVIVTAAAVTGAAGGGGTTAIAFGVVALMAAADELDMTGTLALLALGVLAVEVTGIAFDQSVGTLLGLPLLLAVGVLLGRNRASYRIQAEQSAALLAQHERLRAEQRRADVLDERARIAREIHDVLAHSLGALGIQIQAARALLTDRCDVAGALDTLAAAQRMASEGLTETRRAVHALRTDTDTLLLHEQLARTALEHGERYNVAVPCHVEGAPRPVPPDATVALVRTAQESLINAAKHAPGRDIGVRLEYLPSGVRLTIANDLADGPDTPRDAPVVHTIDGGYGLTGMRERLRLLRGTLEAGPNAQQWVVTADLPLTAAPPSEKADR